MFEWKADAIAEAMKAHAKIGDSLLAMRAALDAAVKAQGLRRFGEDAYSEGYADGHSDGRAEAFEEAAMIAERGEAFSYRGGSRPQKSPAEIAAAIRALAKNPP